MTETSTVKGRAATAALRLAGERPWADVTLLDIAEASGLTLADLRREKIAGKGDVLAAITRSIDDEVLAKAPKRAAGIAPRDAIFEIVMSRLDALAPHKAALRSIFAGSSPDLAHARGVLASQHWMLEAAGVATDGVVGTMKVAGLASIYNSVFRIWLEDDDPGLARTMAALDRRLRRGESTLQSLDGMLASVGRLTGLFASGPKREAKAEQPPHEKAGA